MSKPLPTPSAPQHVAVIMDGNRRWAREHGVPKAIGHARGAKRVRGLVEACMARGMRHLTLFAFSTENWKRPVDEVSSLMGLFVLYLQKEASDMHKNGVRLKVIGDRSAFDARLQALMANVEAMTAHNTQITLTIAANYGGRWDMLQAMQAWHTANPGAPASALTEDALRPHLCLAGAPDPDLLIRTGGESRISNFMLWQSAYTELYFTPALWPDFSTESLDQALAWYAQRDRRFGATQAPPSSQAEPTPTVRNPSVRAEPTPTVRNPSVRAEPTPTVRAEPVEALSHFSPLRTTQAQDEPFNQRAVG